jgi:hypothetical protein
VDRRLYTGFVIGIVSLIGPGVVAVVGAVAESLLP